MEQPFQQKEDVLFVSHSSLTWKSSQRRFRVDRPFYRMLLVFQGVKFETGNVRYMMARQIFSQLFCIIYKRTPCITYQISNTARTTRIGYTAKYQKILALFYKELKFIII